MALARLKALEPALRREGVASLHLFGSTARDEAGTASDVDVFVDLAPDSRLGLAFFGLAAIIEDGLGRRVDVTTREGLHELLRERIEREAIRVF
ncbi:MAG: nucleotidyltransferase family protein [Brevundimonas sp.]